MKKRTLQIVLALVSFAPMFAVKAQDSVADNMLLYQRSVGGWPKAINNVKVNYSKVLSVAEKEKLQSDRSRIDATIDNSATTKEIRYLVKAFAATSNKDYLAAAERGIQYLLIMQHKNGGFPQFFPDTNLYRSQITYNDNAMINALNVLWDAAHRTNGFEAISTAFQQPALQAVERGVDCILKTQVSVNGKLTGWCAQYDSRTLQPARARSFELISLSGMETVGIVDFLMKVEKPSPAVITAVKSAIEWLEAAKIIGFKYVDIDDAKMPKGRDRVLQPDAASVVWARFYEIENNKPFFSGRDGVKKWDLREIEHERRIGYAWYGTWPATLLGKKYPAWKKKNNIS